MPVIMTEINVKELLRTHRIEIDMLDRQIIALLGRRYEIVNEVGKLKAENKVSPVQTDRMQEVLDHVGELAKKNGLSPEFVQELYSKMIDHAHTLEFTYQEDGEYE